MSIPTIAFFNNKGGVGKTSLVFHVVSMLADMGKRVVAADLDPQANLTASFLDEDKLEELWPENGHSSTIYGSLEPLIKATGDIASPHVEIIDHRISLIAGDLALSSFEDQLSEVWPKCLDRDERAFRVTSAFWRIMQDAAQKQSAEFILIDLGPNLGAINRAALISSDCVVVPLGPDLYSLQGLKNLGPKLRQWRSGWQDRLGRNPIPNVPMPMGSIEPLGYVIMQHSVRLDRPVKSYERWISRIPATYREAVLDEAPGTVTNVERDPYCLSLLKHYRSLMAIAQENRKPMFRLRAADGAIGAHQAAALDAGRDFRYLAERILEGVSASQHALATGTAAVKSGDEDLF